VIKTKCILLFWLLGLAFQFHLLKGQFVDYKFTHISIDQGLSHNQVNCFLRDSRGYMWIGTMSGLNRFDGNSFRIFRHDLRDTFSLSDDYIHALAEDENGNIWVWNRNGVNVYDPVKELFIRSVSSVLRKRGVSTVNFNRIYKDNQGNLWFLYTQGPAFKYDIKTQKITSYSLSVNKTNGSDQISSLIEDGLGRFWAIYRNGLIAVLNSQSATFNPFSSELYQKYGGVLSDYSIFVDADNDLWVYCPGETRGVFYINTQTIEIKHFNIQSGLLNNDIVRCVTQDDKGVIWVGTDHGGINLVNKKTFTTRYMLNSPDEAKSLSQNSIISMYKDYQGIIWVGTFKKGLDYYHDNLIKFSHYKHLISKPNSLPYDDVNCFAEDKKGNLWIGTNGGGLIYFDRIKNSFTRYTNQSGNSNSLSNNIIIALHVDNDDKLWIGTYYGGLNCFYNGRFTVYKHQQGNPKSLTDDRVWEIFEDSQNHFWIGTLGGGLDLFSKEKGEFTHYQNGDVNSVQNNCILSLAEDHRYNLWVGTSLGVDVLDRLTGRFIHYGNEYGNPNSLSNNNVITILVDKRGWVWIGTREGLNLFNEKSKMFNVYREEDGLPDNTILTIQEDKQGNLWASTPNGISNVVIKGTAEHPVVNFRNYNEIDGLQGREFNENAAIRLRSGEMVFGGANGFNIFNPEAIHDKAVQPQLIFSSFEVFNKPVKVGEKVNGRTILNAAISQVKEIRLKHSENVISIGFSAIDFLNSDKIRYVYKLEGFNKSWLTADPVSRKATFTNLDPGEYTFKVKAFVDENAKNQSVISLKLIVKPPFWRTYWAFLMYAIIFVGITLFARQMVLDRERLRFRIEQETIDAQRRHNLDVMKLKLLTNISHEFRTPLSLIISPVEKMLKTTNDPDSQRLLLTMQRNARRLLSLVNQLLDFRRMEVQQFKFIPTQGDIVDFLKELTLAFSDLAEKKNIKLKFKCETERLVTFFDHDKLEKIIFNLLSNAFKFTPELGEISISVALIVDNEPSDDNFHLIRIKVKDTGIGIPIEKIDKIFDGFFQDDAQGTIINQGSGIGLALTKEFVKLHGGTISVESEPDKGSCFTVLLPVKDVQQEVIEPIVYEEEITDKSSPKLAETEDAEHDSTQPLLLLVEDNEDFRFYLKDNLCRDYRIMEAANGKEAWGLAISKIPDLVVSDIIMSEMTGIQLCRKLKSDSRTSHIPVILLTSKNSEEQKMEGLNAGADDYIIKPFIFDILEIRIRKLIDQRDSLRKLFQKQIEIKPGDISVTSLDEKLIGKAMEVVEKNISNPDFSVEELSRELGMSRVHLYKKLLSLTGKTPIEFIRTMRLKRAAQLLEKSQMNVSEIAYQTGFNNPKYFAKYFKAEFNVLPSSYAEVAKGDSAK
jgi:signal transduction histidine kinase/ligand-binding sensor domain-containing protein/DNA-binding response OmpR family regulator